jgi:hypothetical protein
MGVPAGMPAVLNPLSPLTLSTTSFIALGPQPERMTGCSGCFDYTTTEGRVNSIAVDPTTTVNGSIVAYLGSVGGGVWKTTNCCSDSTTWSVVTDDPLISTTAIDTITIDPNDHNTIYAGTGDLNFGSFSMGSQGILKSTDAGASWTVLGADVFGMPFPTPPGQFPQYNAVGKVRVDPNDSSKVAAGAKTGFYLSYDGGVTWTGPCATNAFSTQRQDITGLELTDMGGGVTRILTAVGVRGFATTVQFDLGLNGLTASTAPMGSSGCPASPHASNANGSSFVMRLAAARDWGPMNAAGVPLPPLIPRSAGPGGIGGRRVTRITSMPRRNHCGQIMAPRRCRWLATAIGLRPTQAQADLYGFSGRRAQRLPKRPKRLPPTDDEEIAVAPMIRTCLRHFDVWFATRTGTT